MKADVDAALDALDRFIVAAVNLSESWHNDTLDTGYPKRLPSFDEFISELFEWQDAVNIASTKTGERQ